MKDEKENTSKNNDRMKDAADWLKNINPGKVLNSAQQILSTAVDVLEEEIAAGILAAKKLEKKVINVDEIRGNPDELMSRIRRDTHEAIDIFLDALTTLTNHISSLSGVVNKEKQTKAPGSDPKPADKKESIPIIQNSGFAKAGSTVELSLSLSNDSKEPIKIVIQHPTLLGPKNLKILASHISIRPATLTLKPGVSRETILKIKIPRTCKPGTYSGLLCDTTNAYLCTVVNINVA